MFVFSQGGLHAPLLSFFQETRDVLVARPGQDDQAAELHRQSGAGPWTGPHLSHPHADASTSTGWAYLYDANGNMTTRIVGASTFSLSYDNENRLTGVSGAATASFVYDGDGRQVKATVGGVTTVYVGDYYEWTSTESTSYYLVNGQRVAMRKKSATTNVLSWLFTDHLGSTSLRVAEGGGNPLSEMRYKAWGETRYTYGSLLTKDQFTGQRSEMEQIGLYFYNARWYDPALGRFAQADTIVPGVGNSTALDRYAYTLNNPLNYVDPSGHEICDADGYCGDYGADELSRVAQTFGIVFSGGWSTDNKWEVLIAISIVGERFGDELDLSDSAAFRAAYGLEDGDTFWFEWDPGCWGCKEHPGDPNENSEFGYTVSERHIEFATMSALSSLRRINNVIHELGHAFNDRLNKAPQSAVSARNDLLQRPVGFYGHKDQHTWVQSPDITPTDIFADQFLGWTYGLWANDVLGPVRAEFMTRMNGQNGWVAQAAGLP